MLWPSSVLRTDLINRNVSHVVAPFRQVGRWIDAGEGVELLDEVCLIVVAAFISNRCPLHLLGLFNGVKDLVELDDARETFRSQAHHSFKLRDQVLLSDTNLIGEIANSEELRRVLQFINCKRDRSVRFETSFYLLKKECFKPQQFSFW